MRGEIRLWQANNGKHCEKLVKAARDWYSENMSLVNVLDTYGVPTKKCTGDSDPLTTVWVCFKQTTYSFLNC